MWYFIFGTLFGRFILPFFNILIDIFEVFGETIKSKFSVTISENNKKIIDEDTPKRRIIGFQPYDVEEESIDDDEF